MRELKNILPMSIYVHFPWCLRKCPYCDFNSYPLPESKQQELSDKYTNQLLIDLKNNIAILSDRKLTSIYFGGGTPSLLLPSAVKKILGAIKECFIFSSDIEITLEANPGTINFEKCAGFKEAGVNRISLGVQSFSDDKLKKIGRIHNVEQIITAIDAIKRAGFINFNFDLMFGLPEQNFAEALSDLQLALSYSPPHLSWYQLTIEQNTQFATSYPILPHSEVLWEIQQAGQKLLKEAGLIQYEVSAYSKPGYECQHNINYWQYGDYLGIGAGAHSKITCSDKLVKRFWQIAEPMQYLQAIVLTAEEKVLTTKELPFEFMLNALRLYRPINYTLFQECTGVKIGTIKRELQFAQDLGLIELQGDAMTTTIKGRNFLNDLLEIFL